MSEKPADPSPPISSDGDSTDDAAPRSQLKPEKKTGSASPNEAADLQKLDSKVINVDEKEDDPFAHLPPDEAEILRRQLDIPAVDVGFKTLYRYATTNDKIIIVISIICSIAGGAALPLMTVRIALLVTCVSMLNLYQIIFGNLSGSFAGLFNGTLPVDQFDSTLSSYVLYFVYLAIGEFVRLPFDGASVSAERKYLDYGLYLYYWIYLSVTALP